MKKLFMLLAVLAVVNLQAQTKYSHYYTELPCAVEQVQPIVFPDYTVTISSLF